VDYLGCGKYRQRPDCLSGDFIVEKFSNINENIIPFLNKYPLQGNKNKEFNNFCKAGELIKNKAHLTSEGLEIIIKIKEVINKIN
jgi:hypothetical protein